MLFTSPSGQSWVQFLFTSPSGQSWVQFLLFAWPCSTCSFFCFSNIVHATLGVVIGSHCIISLWGAWFIELWRPLKMSLRWWSRRTCSHLLLWELQNWNSLLNNHQQENVGSHQKKIPTSKGKGGGPTRRSVQFRRSVVSDSLQPHESQHARPPCPSPTPGVHPDSCASSQWCHPATSSSVVPFSSCPQFLPASGSFPMSQLFTWGGQSIGVSASASVLPKNTQDWSPLEWTGWISLHPRDLQESSPAPQFKNINSSALSFLHRPTLTSIHDHWKNHSLV